MHLEASNLIIIIACIILIILLLLLYLRSRQGDQRIIRAINSMFLPLLSAILITLGVIFNNSANSTCTGTLSSLKYIATIVALLLIGIGVIRYIVRRNRDMRLITHPVIFAIIIVIAVFAIQQIFGCI